MTGGHSLVQETHENHASIANKLRQSGAVPESRQAFHLSIGMA
jgi:hypothetical protein